ncbi:ABC transporter ATP-binding protein [Acinetobacter qingfengensis]|uniref:ABC transporter ATP-binding protein n=1 Tax=Acinetobacter qingfengensis TaxID=1262585 RepID=A0A1E7R7B1_9GAMM|nr:ABC transporter ATP-binding protein [Acinetobacter qingfengensis]KAA8734419.1 ABC transporter ATP-binding protein [Acinetobacter qingfengensis]OEY95143.1 ABC transporter ATP-binding protein [Acinetobacter qingfengensis]
MPQKPQQQVIHTKNLSQVIQFHDQQLHVLRSIDLTIFAQEQVAITGRSGSGKSTLLGILAALDQPTEGEVWLCGAAIHQLNEEQRARVRLENIGFVFQSFQLLPHLTALDNVLLPLRLQKNYDYKVAKKQAIEMLQRVGLVRQIMQTPKVLSGGEQQRVAIARALVTQPKVVFADEPTGNLDGETAREIEQLLFQMNRELGTTLVLVTHDPKLAAQCQRQIYLADGRLEDQLQYQEA